MTRKPAELKDEEIKAAVQDGLSKAVASMYTITPELIDAYERRAIATAATRKALEWAAERCDIIASEYANDAQAEICADDIRKEIPDA